MLSILQFVANDWRLPTGFSLILAMVFIVVIVLAWTPNNDYANQKTSQFLVTFTSAVGGVLIINSTRRAWALVDSFVIGGLGIAALTWLYPAANTYGRLVAQGSSTISVGRACGAALVALVALVIAGKLKIWMAAALSTPLLYVLAGSGSRGPILAVVIAGIIGVSAYPSRERIRNILVATMFTGFGTWIAIRSTSGLSRQRLTGLLQGHQDTSVLARVDLVHITLNVAWNNPFGIGWGGLAGPLYPLSYPHDVLLEILAEAGWGAAMGFVLLIILCGRRVWLGRRDPALVAVGALFAFFFVNSLVSGDINDNRALFMMIGIAAGASRLLGSVSDAAVSEPSSLTPSSSRTDAERQSKW